MLLHLWELIQLTMMNLKFQPDRRIMSLTDFRVPGKTKYSYFPTTFNLDPNQNFQKTQFWCWLTSTCAMLEPPLLAIKSYPHTPTCCQNAKVARPCTVFPPYTYFTESKVTKTLVVNYFKLYQPPEIKNILVPIKYS